MLSLCDNMMQDEFVCTTWRVLLYYMQFRHVCSNVSNECVLFCW